MNSSQTARRGILLAFGKLQAQVRSAPIIYRFQSISNILLFLATVDTLIFLVVRPATGVLLAWSSRIRYA
ncbi:MAG TPA: hypothetical protein VGF67_19715 [Ktedonobacteraceae bacterium]